MNAPIARTQENGQAWLGNAVLSGLQTLLVLSPQGRPPEDMIEETAAIWQAVFKDLPNQWESEARDVPRIRLAFMRAAKDCKAWPMPKQVIEHLPPVPPKYHDASKALGAYAMPSNILSKWRDALKSEASQIKKGTLKPVYEIRFYLPDNGKPHHQVVYLGAKGAPETTIDGIISQTDAFLADLSTALNGAFKRSFTQDED